RPAAFISTVKGLVTVWPSTRLPNHTLRVSAVAVAADSPGTFPCVPAQADNRMAVATRNNGVIVLMNAGAAGLVIMVFMAAPGLGTGIRTNYEVEAPGTTRVFTARVVVPPRASSFARSCGRHYCAITA